MNAGNGAVITLAYKLDTDGAISEGTMRFVFGSGDVFPKLEEAIEGRVAGEQFDVTLSPHEAYGDRRGDGGHEIPWSLFPSEITPEIGMQLVGQDLTGETKPVWIVDLTQEDIILDFEHPLAGATLAFTGELREVRAATEEELKTGHPSR